MKAGRKKAPEFPPLAGRRVSALSVIAIGFLVVFAVIVLALLVTGLRYEHLTFETFTKTITSPNVLGAIELSIISSLITLALVMIFAVPVGYALSRYRFPGHAIVDTITDIPILLPPVVIGILLLIFFSDQPGEDIEDGLEWLTGLMGSTGLTMHSLIGIVLCQFLVSISYAIRSAKSAFDSVDRRLEQVAMSLGCTDLQAFRRVTLPLVKNGLIAGSIMAWARAVGAFGALVTFVGTARSVRVMPTVIYLETENGEEEVAIVVALMMVVIASIALGIVHWLAPGRKWQ